MYVKTKIIQQSLALKTNICELKWPKTICIPLLTSSLALRWSWVGLVIPSLFLRGLIRHIIEKCGWVINQSRKVSLSFARTRANFATHKVVAARHECVDYGPLQRFRNLCHSQRIWYRILLTLIQLLDIWIQVSLR